jgi:hypothetical protein
LAGAAAVLIVTVGAAAPAFADPSVFGNLSCECSQVVTVTSQSPDPRIAGYQDALTELQGLPGRQ